MEMEGLSARVEIITVLTSVSTKIPGAGPTLGKTRVPPLMQVRLMAFGIISVPVTPVISWMWINFQEASRERAEPRTCGSALSFILRV